MISDNVKKPGFGKIVVGKVGNKSTRSGRSFRNADAQGIIPEDQDGDDLDEEVKK